MYRAYIKQLNENALKLESVSGKLNTDNGIRSNENIKSVDKSIDVLSSKLPEITDTKPNKVKVNDAINSDESAICASGRKCVSVKLNTSTATGSDINDEHVEKNVVVLSSEKSNFTVCDTEPYKLLTKDIRSGNDAESVERSGALLPSRTLQLTDEELCELMDIFTVSDDKGDDRIAASELGDVLTL